ncbi:bacteriocin immunity protein [Lactococcus lactis]|nr:bacteriocin immunity protein [Lactococcus lactis]
MKKKQIEFENELRSMLIVALEKDISQEERNALSIAKKSLDNSEYLPKTILNLRKALTPLAINQTLNHDLSELYKFITSSKASNKNLGGGLIMSWGRLF